LFIAIAIFLTVLFVTAIVLPIVRGGADHLDTDDRARRLDERLLEIEADRAAGLIGEAEAAEAAVETKRLALDAPATRAARPMKRMRLAAYAYAGLAPLAALFIYLSVGAPGLIGKKAPPPAAASIADMAPADQAAAIRGMVDGLAARLKENPEDAEGWRRLARSYSVLGENGRAAGAYRELLSRVAGETEDWRSYAAVLMTLGPGEGREAELQTAMARLKAADPDDPMALFYDAATARAAGDNLKAIGLWRRLLAVIPAEAPVRPTIEKLIAEAEAAASP
jgi:cytochrome c-type biogenesis protein CcmH